MKPNVVRLQAHLPGHHMVTYRPSETVEEVLLRVSRESTTLTAYFDVNREEGEAGVLARSLTYQEFPQKFVLKRDGGGKYRWAIRQRGGAIGRLYFVSPTAGEHFYLRTLLTVVKGARSFEDLRTVGNTTGTHSAFRAACLALGLLEDDGEWRQCFREAVDMHTGRQLRTLFVMLLLFCNLSRPEDLWHEFREGICDDLHSKLAALGRSDPTIEEIYDYGLYLIEQQLQESGHSLTDFPAMPLPQLDWETQTLNRLIAEQLNYDPLHKKTQYEA